MYAMEYTLGYVTVLPSNVECQYVSFYINPHLPQNNASQLTYKNAVVLLPYKCIARF